WFSPSSATKISAIPVVPTRCTSSSTPAAISPASASSASGSSPTAPTMRTFAPSFAAATAWFAPLPPGTRSTSVPKSVSPARGSAATRATRSRLIEPTTVRSGGDGTQVVQRPAEQVLTQVEQAGPQRAAVDRRLEAHLCREPFERAHQHRELEVHLRHPVGRDLHTGPLEHRLPVDELARPRFAEPRLALGDARLELEQVPAERILEPGQRGLHAVGSTPQRRLAAPRRRRVGIAPRPLLEQPAERERGHLDRNELIDQLARR